MVPNPAARCDAINETRPKSARSAWSLPVVAHPGESLKSVSLSSSTQIMALFASPSSLLAKPIFFGFLTPIKIPFTSLMLGLPKTVMVALPCFS